MADYWIKLYMEILDDPKMGTLPDRLWRRTIELFLLAGRLNGNQKTGMLPDTRQLAWALRMTVDDLELDLQQIATTGIIEKLVNGWKVVNFEKRQDADTSTERVRQHRERKQRGQYYGDVTGTKRNVTQNRTEQNRTETEGEEELPPPVSIADKPELVIAYEVTGIYPTFADESRVIDNIRSCRRRMKNPPRDVLLAEMKKTYAAWCNSRTTDGRLYSRSNWSWTDWLATGQLPVAVSGSGKPAAEEWT